MSDSVVGSAVGQSGQIEKTFQAEVTEAYLAEDDSQLSVSLGQIVTVYGEGEDQNGWFYGFLQKDDNTVAQGYFPSTYVTPLGTRPDDMLSTKGTALESRDTMGYSKEPAHLSIGNAGGDFTTSAASMAASEPYRAEQPFASDAQANEMGGDLDPQAVLNTYTKYIEWAAAFTLFIAGCISVADGGGASKALGVIQVLLGLAFAGYLFLKREEFYDSPALLRACCWFVAAIFAFVTPPVGLLSGGACAIAMILNVLSHLNESTPTELPMFHAKLIAVSRGWSAVHWGLIAMWFGACMLFWFCGKATGNKANDAHLGGHIDDMGGVEAWGTMISVSVMFLLFLACRWSLEMLRAQFSMPFGWILDNIQGLNYALITTFYIGTFGHIIAAFACYSGTAGEAIFKPYYGVAPLFTGTLVFYLLIMLFPLFASPVTFRDGPNNKIYGILQHSWIIIIFLLFLHGKGAWGSNFWKYMIAPIICGFIDLAMRRSGDPNRPEALSQSDNGP